MKVLKAEQPAVEINTNADFIKYGETLRLIAKAWATAHPRSSTTIYAHSNHDLSDDDPFTRQIHSTARGNLSPTTQEVLDDLVSQLRDAGYAVCIAPETPRNPNPHFFPRPEYFRRYNIEAGIVEAGRGWEWQ